MRSGSEFLIQQILILVNTHLSLFIMASLNERISNPTNDKVVDWADDKQLDGASVETGGSGGSGMHEPDYDVEVKLVDETSPLFSIKSFEELGL